MKIKAPQLKSDCLELFYKVCGEDIPMPKPTLQAKSLIAKNLAEWLKDEKLLRVTWYGGQALTELVLPDKTEKPEQDSQKAIEGIKAILGSRGVKVAKIQAKHDIRTLCAKIFEVTGKTEDEIYSQISAISKKRRTELFDKNKGLIPKCQ